jgi:hypothetical protein
MTRLIQVPQSSTEIIKTRDQPTLIIAQTQATQIIQTAPVVINTGGGGSKQESINFSYGDVTTQTIYQSLAGQRITRVEIAFDVAFNVASTLSVGDSGNTQRLMSTGQNNPLSTDVYSSHPFHKYASNTNILLTLNTGIGATQGSGVVIVYYE